jgi:hypothetical protein
VDPLNCMACGTECVGVPNGSGVCTPDGCDIECSAGYTDCSGACVDTKTDAANCGACDSP